MPQQFHVELLQRAYEYERASGNYPFNPFHLSADSLLVFNQDWVREYEQFKAQVAAEADAQTAPRGRGRQPRRAAAD